VVESGEATAGSVQSEAAVKDSNQVSTELVDADKSETEVSAKNHQVKEPDIAPKDKTDKNESHDHEKQEAERFTSVEQLRRLFYIGDGGFTELHALWKLEEQQIERGKEYETWFRLHDFWLLAGVITHGYRHWQDILSDQRFDLLNQAFRTENERARKAAFLNRRFQLLEQALVVEEQLRKSHSENPTLIADCSKTSTQPDDKFRPLDDLAACLKDFAASASSGDGKPNKNPKLQKILSQVVALVNDINDASYTNMPASLARGYVQTAVKPIIPRTVQQQQHRPSPASSMMGVMSSSGQWPYKPLIHQQPSRPVAVTVVPQVSMTTAAASTSTVGSSSIETTTSTTVLPSVDSSSKTTKDVICID
jgi:hypothetical protein